MVELTIRRVDPDVSFKAVAASRGKLIRAEPVCALYEKGLVHHVGTFPELESELCTYVPGNRSPNRLDALVWALSDLLLGKPTYGLLDWVARGEATRELARLESGNASLVLRTPTPARPVAVEQAPVCPKCRTGGPW
jgi:hypothetical protein